MSRPIRVLVVMDPIEHIKPAKDSTLAMLLAAQSKGWQVMYAELGSLYLRDGVAWGRVAPLRVFDAADRWFESAGLSIRLAVGWAGVSEGDLEPAVVTARERMHALTARSGTRSTGRASQ